MSKEMDSLKLQLKAERDARIKLETYSRRSNLRFYGVSEKTNENDTECERVLRELWADKFGITDNISIERCHRMGPRPKPGEIRSRPVIVKFSFYKDRERVWRARKNLAGTKIYMKEDFPPEVEKRVDTMLPIFFAARRNPEFTSVKLVIDKLFLNGTMFTVETIDRLPIALRPESLTMKTDGNITWFFKKDCHLSNHFPCQLTDTEGTKYNSVEQYYMSRCALFFNDQHAHDSIMDLDDAGAIKRVKIKNFNPEAWKRENLKVMKSALHMKYSQNPDLRDKLLNTKNTVLCEANPRDTYWGIGIGMHHPDAANISKWGSNHLGKLLQELREQYKSDMKN